MSGADRVARARAMLGVPFRLHGRDERGLDCVGLAAVTLGRAVPLPQGYGLRSGDGERAQAWLAAAGLVRVDDPVPGDVALVRPGPLQLHLMIHVPGGFVHAHAGLRRVVESPGACAWPVIGHWRDMEGESDGDGSADGGRNGAGRADRRGDRRSDRQHGRSCGAVPAQGAGWAAPFGLAGADVELRDADPQTVRDDAGGGDGHLGKRSSGNEEQGRRR